MRRSAVELLQRGPAKQQSAVEQLQRGYAERQSAIEQLQRAHAERQSVVELLQKHFDSVTGCFCKIAQMPFFVQFCVIFRQISH